MTTVITGANGRLARYLAASFAPTSDLIMVDRETSSRPLPPNATWHTADLTDEAAVTALFQEIAAAVPSIDVLIHTVGNWDGRPFVDTSLEDWNNVMHVNLQTAFLCFREACRHMQDKGGCLIGVTSGQGADRGVAQQAAYSAAKAGVMRLVEAVAAEFQDPQIRAHAIAPSMILYDGMEDQAGVRAQDLADACQFLVSPVGGALNGQVMRVYGG